MRLERVSWGKWIALALAVGTVIAWLHVTVGQTAVVQTHAQVQFIAMLNRKPVSGGDGKEYPWIKSILVYPAIDLMQPYAKATSRKAQVTYQMLTAASKGAWQYVPKSSLVDDPIDLGGKGPQPLMIYLAGVAKDRPWVSYRYAYWNEPRWTYTIWVGGSLLLLGVIWPLVLRRLAAAGYAGQEDDDRPSLWQRLFGRKAAASPDADNGVASAAKTSPMSLSEDDLQRIAAMEAGLGDFKVDHGPGGEVDDEAEPEIKKLVAGPLDSATAPVKQEVPKEYAGEYYPTATHVKKKET
jgi:hypothetical protein